MVLVAQHPLRALRSLALAAKKAAVLAATALRAIRHLWQTDMMLHFTALAVAEAVAVG